MADRVRDLRRAGLDRVELALLDHRRRTVIGWEPDRDRPLRDDVRQLPPLVDELVELKVWVAEAWAGDIPVELFADQGEGDQLDESQLAEAAGLLAIATGRRTCRMVDGRGLPTRQEESGEIGLGCGRALPLFEAQSGAVVPGGFSPTSPGKRCRSARSHASCVGLEIV